MEILEVGGLRYLRITWSRLEGLVEELAAKIESDYAPDTIIGILRGGVIVAHFLSDIFDFKELYTIGCTSYEDIRVKRGLRIYSPLALKDLSDRRVLLVDDVADSGGTLREVLEKEVKPKNPLEVRTATLHVKPWRTYDPDYYVEVTDAWIVYPWERYEMTRQLAPKFIEHYGPEEGVKILAEFLGEEAGKIKARIMSR